MKRICWITSSYLLDVDLPIVPRLQEEYDIEWIILTTEENRDGDKKQIERSGCQKYDFIVNRGIFISPKQFFTAKELVCKIKNGNYDVYYFDYLGMPFFMPLVQHYLPKEKCVIAAHNVKTPRGARYYWLAKTYMDYVIKSFDNFQVYSRNQFEMLSSKKNKAKILYAPLCLKDYGEPTIQKLNEQIIFLFFGNIVEYKRVDLLLKAVRVLKERGITDFKVKISGYCRPEKWAGRYEKLCKGLDNVELDIRRIPNEAIPDLFESSHFFVMPYQDIAQSGAMTVALRYNIPIIASELEVFKEFMSGVDDGYFFESGNVEELANTMLRAMEEYSTRYNSMRDSQAKCVKEKLSVETILLRYKNYIDCLCHN